MRYSGRFESYGTECMNKLSSETDHPSDDKLLRYVDGELNSKHATAVRRHLEACWQCRAATEELQETIRDYVHFHKERILPSIPTPPRYWHGFGPMLSRMEAEHATVTAWRQRFLGLCGLVPRPVWFGGAAGVSAIALAVFLIMTLSRPHVLTAAEFLHRAEINESAIDIENRRPVRIRYRGETFVRRVGNRLEEANMAPIQALFRQSRLDWNNPLSAEAFTAWHDELRSRSDQLRTLDDRIMLDTRTQDGDLARAIFTVRKADYHPIEETLDFGQAGMIEISELAPNAPELLALSNPKPSMPERRSAPMRLDSSPTTAVNPPLEDVEAELRSLLHMAGADIREVLTIRRAGDELEVVGVVSDSRRRMEIADHVGALRQVSLNLKTIEEAVTNATVATAVPLKANTGQSYDASATEWLLDKFPNASDREDFVKRTLQLSRDMSVRTYALSQLADRYPPAVFDSLSSKAQKEISQIVADLAANINEDHDNLDAHLNVLIDPPPVGSPGEPWQLAASQCSTFARGLDDALTALFAASTERPGDFDSLLTRLMNQISGICRIKIP